MRHTDVVYFDGWTGEQCKNRQASTASFCACFGWAVVWPARAREESLNIAQLVSVISIVSEETEAGWACVKPTQQELSEGPVQWADDVMQRQEGTSWQWGYRCATP